MISTGIKTKESDNKVTSDFVNEHISIGIDALTELIKNGHSVRHLKF
jgi:AMP nucleosidase